MVTIYIEQCKSLRSPPAVFEQRFHHHPYLFSLLIETQPENKGGKKNNKKENKIFKTKWLFAGSLMKSSFHSL